MILVCYLLGLIRIVMFISPLKQHYLHVTDNDNTTSRNNLALSDIAYEGGDTVKGASRKGFNYHYSRAARLSGTQNCRHFLFIIMTSCYIANLAGSSNKQFSKRSNLRITNDCFNPREELCNNWFA